MIQLTDIPDLDQSKPWDFGWMGIPLMTEFVSAIQYLVKQGTIVLS